MSSVKTSSTTAISQQQASVVLLMLIGLAALHQVVKPTLANILMADGAHNSDDFAIDEQPPRSSMLALRRNQHELDEADNDFDDPTDEPTVAAGSADSPLDAGLGYGGQLSTTTAGQQLEAYDEPNELATNIDHAKIELTSGDLATAAGHHHHHHKHYVHGKLEMGAHTGKKGSFGWHDKHPVGGKGRR